jgi:hypothetical protein
MKPPFPTQAIDNRKVALPAAGGGGQRDVINSN